MKVQPSQAQVKQPLSFSEEKAINQKEQELKAMIGDDEIAEGIKYDIQDKEALKKQLSELKKIKEERSVDAFRDRNISDLEKEEIELRKKLQESEPSGPMPTWKELQFTTKKDGPKYQKLMAWHTKSNSDVVRQNDIRRWKALRRAMDPSDPRIDSTVHLYKEQ